MGISFNRVFAFIGLYLLTVSVAIGQTQKVEIVDYYTSPCDRSTNPKYFKDRIVSELLYGDTLQIIIKTSGNCNGIHSPEAKLINDTLWITYIEGREQEEFVDSNGNTYFLPDAACDCCFEHVFLIKELCTIPNGVYIPGGTRQKKTYTEEWYNFDSYKWEDYYKFLGSKFEIVDGDTVNLTDKYSQKQGLWLKEPKSSNEDEYSIIIELEPEEEEEGFEQEERLKDSYKCFFVNDEIKTGEIIEYYQPFNILKYHKVYTNFNTYKETFYDIDGNITKVIKSSPEEK